MAIIKCKECGSEVSSKAKICPKCGYKVSRGIGCGSAIGVVILVFIAISVISGAGTKSYNNSKSDSQDVNAKSQDSTPTPNIVNVPGDQWIYHQNNDPMSKGLVHQARVSSANTVNFDFPYSGPQHATLILRTHPRYGKDIIFSIERGQFLCSSYDGCKVLIRFDEEEPVKYSASAAADNSSETIFIGNYNKFVSKMLKANTVRISASIYKENAPVFEFDVSNFDVKKYKPNS